MCVWICFAVFSLVVLCVVSFCLTAFMGIRWSAGPCVSSCCLTLYTVGPLVFSAGPSLPAAVISAVWETQYSTPIQLPRMLSPLYLSICSICLSVFLTYAMSLDNTLACVSFTFPIKQKVMAGSRHEHFHTLSHTSELEWEWPWDGICTTQQSSFSPGFGVSDVSLVTSQRVTKKVKVRGRRNYNTYEVVMNRWQKSGLVCIKKDSEKVWEKVREVTDHQ